MSGYDASEWKAGDVGILDYKFAKGGLAMRVDKCGDHEFRGPHWHFANGDRGDGSGAYRIRPLVVIDPEDAEQVERFREIASRWADQVPYSDMRENGDLTHLDAMQAALREFARPTPRIEEPQGLGAVVEDGQGLRWVRSDRYEAAPWDAARLEKGGFRWADIHAVRILSPGVTP